MKLSETFDSSLRKAFDEATQPVGSHDPSKECKRLGTSNMCVCCPCGCGMDITKEHYACAHGQPCGAESCKEKPQEKKPTLIGYNCKMCHGTKIGENDFSIVHVYDGILEPIYAHQPQATQKSNDVKIKNFRCSEHGFVKPEISPKCPICISKKKHHPDADFMSPTVYEVSRATSPTQESQTWDWEKQTEIGKWEETLHFEIMEEYLELVKLQEFAKDKAEHMRQIQIKYGELVNFIAGIEAKAYHIGIAQAKHQERGRILEEVKGKKQVIPRGLQFGVEVVSLSDLTNIINKP